MPFKFLFRVFEQSQDGFKQPEREAIVDVLHYCMYADQHVAASEEQMIKAVAQTLSWDNGVPYEGYEGKSIAAVREALSSPEALSSFFDSVRSRLKTDSRTLALQLAEKVVNADGQRKPDELIVLANLRKALAA